MSSIPATAAAADRKDLIPEVVVDLDSNAGLHCLQAARQVGAVRRVIGVDMTMIC
jgi:23S rRNA U2552 (ribose-2'-O)-methylase RlmE/FtsJ